MSNSKMYDFAREEIKTGGMQTAGAAEFQKGLPRARRLASQCCPRPVYA
ncbi:MAG: hypothetical protein ACLP51_00275 [Syntrophobacteraceae bacterium]